MIKTTSSQSQTTVLDELKRKLRSAAQYDSNYEVEPAAILWTDETEEWRKVLSIIRAEIPNLFTLGDYASEKKRGPAIWLKCVVAGETSIEWPKEDRAPIIYLPGVSRDTLRKSEECPEVLKPLIELQYRGVYWTQQNTRDWSVYAFMVSDHEGLGLEIAEDMATKDALNNALKEVLAQPISKLGGHLLEADDFHSLIEPDSRRALLEWIDDPDGFKNRSSESRWKAFLESVKEKYGFNPVAKGALEAAKLLGKRETKEWREVWQRFSEAPQNYPNIPERLQRATPREMNLFEGNLHLEKEENVITWPKVNDKIEGEIERTLKEIPDMETDKAVQKVEGLEDKHGKRRSSVWSKLGKAPLTDVLKPLYNLARKSQQTLTAESTKKFAAEYVNWGWEVDLSVLRLLDWVYQNKSFEKLIVDLVRFFYEPWLMEAAEEFQDIVKDLEYPEVHLRDLGGIEKGTIFLFVDALRLDIANLLVEDLSEKKWDAEMSWRWAPLPTVTSTAKVANSPVAGYISKDSKADSFSPIIEESGKELNHRRFKGLLEELGVQYVGDEKGSGSDSIGWTEIGELDSQGHREGWKLAWRVDELLSSVEQRIKQLSENGWQEIRIVTDHGWLLLPGELPKQELPSTLTKEKWGRCASLPAGQTVNTVTYPWFWNQQVEIAYASGISQFARGNDYAHGGISPQECIIPDIKIDLEGSTQKQVEIERVEWRGLRCRVNVSGDIKGIEADIRKEPPNAESSIVTESKVVEMDKEVSLLVSDDLLEGEDCYVVLVDSETGDILNQQNTTVGLM